MSSFLESQEKIVVFTLMDGEDNTWEGQDPTGSLMRSCIVSNPTTSMNPAIASGGSVSIRIFSAQPFTGVKRGDLATVMDVDYSVTDVNNSGSLPGPYPYRAYLRRDQ